MDGGEGTVVLCYGNPAREDDGIGPELAERLEGLALAGVRVESNYQLMVEDAATIAQAAQVIFVDASVDGKEPFSFSATGERSDMGYMAHTIDPERLLGLTRETFGRCPPAYSLAVRGYSFAMFKEGLPHRASENLTEALNYLIAFLRSNGAQKLHTQGTAGAGERARGGST